MAQSAQWELSKENILPMKSGRDVAVLNAALGEESSSWKEQRLREWRSFQDRLVANEQNKEELLNAYYDLLCWLDNTFPQGGKKYIKLNAKRCFHKLKDDKSFHDNWKFMKVMIKYIEASGESCRYISETTYCDLYNYMYIHHIGTKHADFFISWANALEASESYAQAATVFNKGLQLGAEPRKMLEKEKALFEDRMALRTIEEMIKGENEKLPPGERRQPLQQQGTSASRGIAISDEESTVRLKKSTELDRSLSSSQPANARQSFSVHIGKTDQRAGQISAAFTAVSAPPASNVVPIKHQPDKENAQKAEQWAKPSQVPPRPSNRPSSMKPKPTSSASSCFKVYSDEPEESANVSTCKPPIFLSSSVLRQRKDDEAEDGDDSLLLDKTSSQAEGGSKSKGSSQSNSGESVRFMFNEDAVVNGPLGEMSFEELRANYVQAKKKEEKPVDAMKTACLALKVPRSGEETVMEGFLNKDDEEVTKRHDIEADLTMALNVEVSRRGLSKTDAGLLGQTAFADSMLVPASGDAVNDSWTAVNQTAESVRSTQGGGDADISTSLLPEPTTANQTTNKLSVTQFDCLSRILSEAFRGPSQAAVAPPFGLNSSEETISAEPEPSINRSNKKPPSRNQVETEFVPFQDSVLNESNLKADAPQVDFIAYEDSFAVPKQRIALQAHSDSVESEDKKLQLIVYEDSFAAEKPAQQTSAKRLALKVRSDDPPSDLIMVNDDESGEVSPKNGGESPCQKRKKQNHDMFSEGLAECSDIVADFPLAGGGGGFNLSTTIDFSNKPKFCSTQYVDVNLSKPGNENELNFLVNEEDFASDRPSVNLQGGVKRPPPKRQSITARVSTMPPLQERSESSSSGGSTMAMHSALQTVRESGLSAIWESNAAGSVEQPPPPAIEESIALPTMNCEVQKSYHYIDVEKFIAYSQCLQQSMAFANKTYSCLREVDPTDPFSDELVGRFVAKYEPALRKMSNYIEMLDRKMPDFFVNNRQSTTGKVVQFAPGFSLAYAFRVGSGAYASVVAARDVETRKLYALKFQFPACKWEFYLLSELRQRLQRKFNIASILDGFMEIDRALIYKDGSCYALQHVRYGPLLNLVNKSREHKLDLSEPVTMYLTIELLRLVESMHACHVMHADLKPDNVLFLGLPDLPKLTRNSSGQQVVFPPREASIRIIDFGRSIDLTLFPPGTAFLAKVSTSGFDCIEMKTDRPWTYQADYFGLAGTIHVLIFLEYMRVSFEDNSAEGRWTIGKKFKRWWHHNDLWERLFDTLLNIPDCDHQPDIKSLREAFEVRFVDKTLSNYTLSQASVMTTMKEHFHAN